MRRRNIQHGQARRHPMPRAWPVLAGILLAVAIATLVLAPSVGGAGWT